MSEDFQRRGFDSDVMTVAGGTSRHALVDPAPGRRA
jgi:hypothetical protein